MKNVLSSVGILFLSLAALAQDVPALKVEGVQLRDNNGKIVMLRGVSFGWHNWWPRFYNASTVAWLKKDWHCNVVRAAMGVEPANGYLQKREWSEEKIRAVVDAAIKENMYVIIDWHCHNIRLNEAKDFFIRMAKDYGRYPNVIYELFNEPERQSWADVKTYATEIIGAIREVDPDNIILVGSPHWDQDLHLAADDPVKGFTNIMYTLHYYAATHKQWLRDRADYALSKGLPLFISESAGMSASGDGPIDETEWANWTNWAESKKVSWITWSVSDKNETCSMLQPSTSDDGGWKTIDLKESGIRTKAMLIKFSGSK